MQNSNEKDLQAASECLTNLGNRIKELQQSILALLNKLEMQDRLEWPVMLENFAVISSQFNSLMQILQNSRTPNLKNFVYLPILLSPDVDPNLQALTDNRLSIWSHAIVPDYLRTKLDERIEDGNRRVIGQGQNTRLSNIDQLTKLITGLNKGVANILDSISQAAKDELDVEGTKLNESSNMKDTEQLVLAVSLGIGLKPNQPPQVPGGGKYTSSVKSALNAVAGKASQPYGR